MLSPRGLAMMSPGIMSRLPSAQNLEPDHVCCDCGVRTIRNYSQIQQQVITKTTLLNPLYQPAVLKPFTARRKNASKGTIWNVLGLSHAQPP